MPLLSLDPFSQPETLPLPPTDISSIISTITSYYTFLTLLPHICPSSLHIPPSDKGWPDVDEETLRTQCNRSEKAISLLKHLPCLHRPSARPENPYEDRSVSLSPDTLGIAYNVGEVWDDGMHRECPTPGNVVWLGKMDGWDGTALLLDVDIGTITEFSMQSHGPPLMSFQEREALATKDRWMSYPTWSVRAYFGEARRLYERLVWIPKPGRSGVTGRWDVVLRVGNEATDDDFGEMDETFSGNEDMCEPDEEDRPNEVEQSEDRGDSNSETDDALDEKTIPEDEVAELLNDARPDGVVAQVHNAQRVLIRSVTLPPRENEEEPAWLKEEKRDWEELIAIYRHNQWPGDGFDRQGCTRELFEWQAMADARRREESRARRRL